jgi:hypothetical protein
LAFGALKGRAYHLDPLAAEDLVEGRAELRVAIVDQETHRARPSAAVEHEVARLLGGPGAARVRGYAREVDPACCELDEEQHVEAPQPHRLDGQEVASEHALRLGAQKTSATKGQSAEAPAASRGA